MIMIMIAITLTQMAMIIISLIVNSLFSVGLLTIVEGKQL